MVAALVEEVVEEGAAEVEVAFCANVSAKNDRKVAIKRCIGHNNGCLEGAIVIEETE